MIEPSLAQIILTLILIGFGCCVLVLIFTPSKTDAAIKEAKRIEAAAKLQKQQDDSKKIAASLREGMRFISELPDDNTKIAKVTRVYSMLRLALDIVEGNEGVKGKGGKGGDPSPLKAPASGNLFTGKGYRSDAADALAYAKQMGVIRNPGVDAATGRPLTATTIREGMDRVYAETDAIVSSIHQHPAAIDVATKGGTKHIRLGLEWREESGIYGVEHHARVDGVTYEIYSFHPTKWKAERRTTVNGRSAVDPIGTDHASLEAAKAACVDDYVRRAIEA